ncbi:MAG TPA: amino acid ABC transporter substrate-binding protein, partial [Caballeronia sp.]|nr:amino acid ABC transporter substrate-binding protein [Caballeronia sp.]
MRLVKESARIACLFAVAGLLTLAGCTKVATPAQDGGAESTLKAVLQRGTLRVGDCLSFAPFGFYNKDGAADGY